MRNQLKFALVVLIALLVACGADDRPLNVLIIAIDTLRADHLGCYGYERGISPNIDELASGGVLVERAVSQAPWTLPSFASVFTSLYPTQHGATTVDSRVRPSVPTLASILKDAGYLTAALVNAPLLEPGYGLATGFDLYDSPPPDSIRIADRITGNALSWLASNKDQPFFLFVHYFDPHLPYAPPVPFDRMFSPDYEGPIRGSFDLDHFSSRNRSEIREEIAALSPDDRDRIVALYDGEIAFTDSAVGLLLDGLRDHKLDRRTLVILMSDHGEEFFDHGGLDHGHTFFDELLSVPLVFRLPGILSGESRLGGQARLIDIAPTILDVLGMEAPGHFEGMSLLPSMTGAGLKRDENDLLPPGDAYAEALRRDETVKCLSSHPWKLILDTRTSERSLFNLEEDPHERQDAGGTQPSVDRRLEQAIYRTVFGMSDSWYVEMEGGGEHHIFDISIKVGSDPVPGSIGIHGFLDPDNTFTAGRQESPVEVLPGALRIENLQTKGRVTLAFTAGPGKAPVEFDLAIDRQPAISRTFLGRSMTGPETMPFSRVAGRKSVRSRGAPSGEAEPPYFLVWHSESRFTGRNKVKLNEGTTKALKALGYIQ